jgi:hypothetical protein
VKGLFRPHYVSWSERIEFQAPGYVRSIIRIITESGLRVYRNKWIWETQSYGFLIRRRRTASPRFLLRTWREKRSGIDANRIWLFPSDENRTGHQKTLKTVWHAVLRRAKVPYFRIYDRRSTRATRLSAGGVADEWVTQLLRQGDAKVFKKYSQMKLQMKRNRCRR